MPTSADPPDLLVDTSVAISLLVADHPDHDATHAAVGRRSLGLSGHAYFETSSVLTRLPGSLRRGPQEVAMLLRESFPKSRFLDAGESESLIVRFGDLEIAGGAVYDALVGHTAAVHGLALVTRDARAIPIYRLLSVDLRVLN